MVTDESTEPQSPQKEKGKDVRICSPSPMSTVVDDAEFGDTQYNSLIV
jgi:hypothetical protein